MKKIIRVWIDENVCLVHGCCVSDCPEVFVLGDVTAKIRPDAERYFVEKDAEIRLAADGCPMECIHIEAI